MTTATATDRASHDAQQVPTRQELVDRAHALRDLLWAGAPDSDRNRRLNDSSVAAIVDAGLTKLFTPRRFGGYETDTRTMLDVCMALARGDGAAGWITGIMTASGYILGLFPDQAQDDVWGANPGAKMSAILAPTAKSTKVDGGFEVTGRWGFMSGCLHSDWAMICFPMETAGGAPGVGLVPTKDLAIEDNWYTTGLRGTGSNTVIADKLFIPDHRVIILPPAMEGEPASIDLIESRGQSLYRSSFSGVLLTSLVGIMIGEAQAALEFVVEKAPARAITTTNYAKQSNSVAFQLDIAEAASKIDAAAQVARHAADEIDEAARRGVYPAVPERAKARIRCAQAAKLITEAMDILMSAHGTAAFAEASPLARLWRDTAIAGRHAGLGSRISQEIYGRVLLDLDPRTVSYVL